LHPGKDNSYYLLLSKDFYRIYFWVQRKLSVQFFQNLKFIYTGLDFGEIMMLINKINQSLQNLNFADLGHIHKIFFPDNFCQQIFFSVQV